MSTKLHKINNDSIVVPEFMFKRIKSMVDIGETEFKNFVNDRLIFGKKSHQTSTQITSKFGTLVSPKSRNLLRQQIV